MKIQLKTDPKGEYREIQVNGGTTLEELYKSMKEQLPYTIMVARVDNTYEDLNYRIEKECRVELLDARTQAANYAYQYSLTLIYLKAVRDVLGNVRVEVANSLNQGLFTEIKGKEGLNDKTAKAIENRMRELVKADIPFVKEIVSREEGLDIIRREGWPANLRLIERSKRIQKVIFYSLEDYKDYFYGLMVPSTGYVQDFQVVKYKRGMIVRFPLPASPDGMPGYIEQKTLYDAFAEQTMWDNLLKVNYVVDLNEKIENGDYKELIQVSEALHEKKIAEIADMIKHRHKRIILIAGPSSSGKTTFARRLCVQLKVNGLDPLYMGTDDYFVDREDTPLDENGEKNYEGLEAIDISLFNSNMNDLLAGKEVDLPTFNFLTGEKEYGKRITSIKSNQLIVIEGIHGLNEKMTEEIDDAEKFKIYISPLTQLNIDEHNRVPTTDERMLRRMVRDSLYRGHDAQSTIRDWPKVRAGEDKNIFPYSGEADVLFNSYHVYEINVLKKYAEPLLEKVSPNEPEYAEAERMLRFLAFFDTIEDDSMIVNNSIIREFIGGSIFVD
ncbi:nucleoside kinase [Aminicella lysinilytica]|uniref:Uridine kinase n=1 Tax=Aminicella lysinilytica TaxID=433323 RepID=A0A4R6Q221_9FIRM|nr:nucleoside kinase [Aminicella lysinilytica]TDP54935.1 uridine kinase [Aminicella lysinilytica]